MIHNYALEMKPTNLGSTVVVVFERKNASEFLVQNVARCTNQPEIQKQLNRMTKQLKGKKVVKELLEN